RLAALHSRPTRRSSDLQTTGSIAAIIVPYRTEVLVNNHSIYPAIFSYLHGLFRDFIATLNRDIFRNGCDHRCQSISHHKDVLHMLYQITTLIYGRPDSRHSISGETISFSMQVHERGLHLSIVIINSDHRIKYDVFYTHHRVILRYFYKLGRRHVTPDNFPSKFG